MGGWSRPFVAAIGLALPAGIACACSLVVSTDGLADGEDEAGAGQSHITKDAGGPLPSKDASGDGGAKSDSGSAVDASYATSCADILRMNPATASGSFTIGSGSDARTVHCEMTLAGGGWTQAIDFDASRDGCPSTWTFASAAGGCARMTDGADSALFPTPLAAYSEVLLAAVGRQDASTDAFHDNVIDAAYVDGISITTRIDGSRVHVFTFASGLTDDPSQEPSNHCPCDPGGSIAPDFVGGNFLCDTGAASGYPSATWLEEDLWDQDARGADCATAPAAGPRFSSMKLPRSSSSPIEVRLMADQERSNEDIALKRLVLYVR